MDFAVYHVAKYISADKENVLCGKIDDLTSDTMNK